MEERTKEVYFGKYCQVCEHKDLAEDEDPCFNCLAEPSNVDSHKPIYYVEKNTNKKSPS